MEEITFLFCKLLNLLDFLGCRSRSEGTQGFKLTTCIFGIINSLISRNKNECLCFYCNLSLYLDFNTHILRLCVRFWARRSRQASPTPPPPPRHSRLPLKSKVQVGLCMFQNLTTKIITEKVRPSYMYVTEVV